MTTDRPDGENRSESVLDKIDTVLAKLARIFKNLRVLVLSLVPISAFVGYMFFGEDTCKYLPDSIFFCNSSDEPLGPVDPPKNDEEEIPPNDTVDAPRVPERTQRSTHVSVTWQTFIVGSGDQEAAGIQVAEGGALFVVGNSTLPKGSDKEVLLYKLDAVTGKSLWNEPLTIDGIHHAHSFQLDKELGAAVAGFRTPSASEKLLKESVVVLWDPMREPKKQTWERFSCNGSQARDLKIVGGKSIFVVGESRSKNSGSINICALRPSANKVINWDEQLKKHRFSFAYSIESYVVGGLGRLMIVGSTYNSRNGKRQLLTTTVDTKDGKPGEFTLYDAKKYSGGDKIVRGPEGSFFLGGYTGETRDEGYDGWLVKIDRYGGTLWSKQLGGPGRDEITSLVWDGREYLYVAGTTSSFGGGENDLWLIKLDSGGNIQWQYAFGSQGNENAKEIYVTEKGDIFVVGTIDRRGHQKKIWVMSLSERPGAAIRKEYNHLSPSIIAQPITVSPELE